MANGRRPIPPMRAYTAAVLGVFALFVVSVGAGMASWSIVVLGVALIILAVSLVVVSAMRGGARAYVAGTAHVVSASKPPASSVYGRCELHLLIDAPGMATSAVTIRDPRVPVAKWPDAGTTLPIMVAVDDPRRVRVQWDDVPTHAETAADEDEDEYVAGYAEDYSEEYPEYVPLRDPLDLASDPTPVDADPPPPAGSGQAPADRGEPAAADLTGLREGGLSAEQTAPTATATEPTRTEPTHTEPTHTEPAPARAASAPATEPEAPPGPPPQEAPPGPRRPEAPPSPWRPEAPPSAWRPEAPPGPLRPEAFPETPEEAYPVDGEPVFSPKVPPAPERDDLVDSAAGSAEPAPSIEDSPAPPLRPRPKPQATAGDERPGASAPISAAAATGTAAATTGTAVASPDLSYEESAEAQGQPSVTAIEFDLGKLIPAYPSARPGRAGPIHGVGITVHVRDLAESAAFYRDLLGFYEIDGGDGNVVLASGDTRLVLRAVRDVPPVDPRMVHINLEVADVHAVYEELKAKGVRFTYGPRPTSRGERLEPWAATFRDPDGHGITITQWRTRSR